MSVDIIEDAEDLKWFNEYFLKAQRKMQIDIPDNGWDTVDLYCKLYSPDCPDAGAVGGDRMKAMYRHEYMRFMDGHEANDTFLYFEYKSGEFREESGIVRLRDGVPQSYWGMTRSYV